MKDTETQSLSEIEKLIWAKKFREAQLRLDEFDTSKFDDSASAHFWLLTAEVGLYSGRNNFSEILNVVVEFYRNRNDNNKFAKAKFLVGWMLLTTGKHADARESFLEAYVSYKRCNDFEGIARSLNQMAYISLILGELDMAINSIRQCMEFYGNLNDKKAIGIFSNNLAHLYHCGGLLRDAAAQYIISREYIEHFGVDYAAHFYLGLAITKSYLCDTPAALRLITKAGAISKDLRREQAQYYEYLGAILNHDGKFADAERNLLKGLDIALEISSESDHSSQTKRLLADSYLGLKKYDLAQKFAEEALLVASKISERAEIAACYRVFAQVGLHGGENDKARAEFRKAIDLFSMIKSRYELAVTRYLFASSDLCDHNERTAQLYLAKEYFESEEIKPYIDKVNSELSSIGKPKLVFRQSGNGAPVFIARAASTKKIVALAEQIAPSDMTVLLTGPTGAGKDQLAKYIHWFSGRKGNFVPVNCAAIPETMVESELFGHRKGAFTGGDYDKPGLFETANEGTLYLNEIADSRPEFQAKLLEVIESKAVRRLGCTECKKVNVRIIAATNQDLKQFMLTGKFRIDLYHRLNEIPITLPPLSERPEDIPELVHYFLMESGFDVSSERNKSRVSELADLLFSRDWAGNVRELEAEIKRLSMLYNSDLSAMIESLKQNTLSERERLAIALEQTGWNQREAARRLNMTEGGVRYLIKKHFLFKGSDA